MKFPSLGLILAALLPISIASAQVPSGTSGTRPSVDGQATEVMVATYLIDVSKINGADQSFTADLFVALSWHDPRLDGVFETVQQVPLESIWSPQLLILNRRQVQTTFPDQAEIAPNGNVTIKQRYFGNFSAPLNLHEFPLDRQRFTFRMVVTGFGPDELHMVTAPAELTGDGRSETFSISDWDLSEVQAQPEPYRVAAGGRALSGYVVSFDGRRHIGFWAGKAFISIGIIIAMSWLVFWIDPKYVAPRLSVAVTSMLTLIAYRFLLDGVLPRLSYLTRMDYFLIGSTLLVLLTVIQVVITTAAADRDHGRQAARINRHSRWVFPTTLLVLMALSFWRI